MATSDDTRCIDRSLSITTSDPELISALRQVVVNHAAKLRARYNAALLGMDGSIDVHAIGSEFEEKHFDIDSRPITAEQAASLHARHRSTTQDGRVFNLFQVAQRKHA